LSDTEQRPRAETELLAAFCDALVAPLDGPAGDRFARRSASDLGVPEAVPRELTRESRRELELLLATLDAAEITSQDAREREATVRALLAEAGPAGHAARLIKRVCLLLFYGELREESANPNWPVMGYELHPARAPAQQRPSPRLSSLGPTTDVEICIVGSGPGGAIAAHELSGRGLDVLVLERGSHYPARRIPGEELWAYRHLFRGGGLSPTEDEGIGILAGSCLGGGSVVNWATCLALPDRVREQWAEEHGLSDLAEASYEADLAHANRLLGINLECSELNGPNRKLKSACERLGCSHHVIARNVDPGRHDPDTAGYTGFGDRSDAKNSAPSALLAPAQAQGARIVTDCEAKRLIIRRGRVQGVSAEALGPGGVRQVEVRARHVVLAAGALDTPALLLRSGVGDPSIGRYLHLHPATFVIGYYDEPQRAWWGTPQSVVCDQFASRRDGHGFLIECTHARPGLNAAALPWRSAAQHKDAITRMGNAAYFISLTRDRGVGTVTVDRAGGTVVRHPLDDPTDRANILDSAAQMARLHHAAGANAIQTARASGGLWRKPASLDAFLREDRAEELVPRSRALFSLHQMGSCRIGLDPDTSPTSPSGELRAVRGVWIADTSAFPTACGVNPMLTVLALARRMARSLASQHSG
jgi:choline dehydrogenase-like flavoprotein